MKTKRVLICLLAVIVIIQSCSRKSAAEFNSDFNKFSGYINNFTAGIVPASSDIRVVLAKDRKEWKSNQVLDRGLFKISPEVDGKVVALSPNTVAFIPENKLKSDTEYQVTFNLGKVLEVNESLASFNFSIRSIKQDFVVNTSSIQSYDKEFQYLKAVFRSADAMDISIVSEIISATQGSKKLSVKFDKQISTSTEVHFIIDSIQRLKGDSEVQIAYDGKPAGVSKKGIIKYQVVGRDNFKVVDVVVPENNNQTLLINFSDPLLVGQDLSGLISLEDSGQMSFSTNGNVLKVFFEEPLKGERLLEVFQGIQSDEGFKMKAGFAKTISFEPIKPQVRLVKNGTIMPSSNNLKLNFEAVNLSAVDVKVYKIYKNNILQFLQYNDINGSYDLKRVGQPVARTTINLTLNKLVNFAKWNTYALDLSKIINPEQGAIYRVEFSFRKAYSLYTCDRSESSEETGDAVELNENDVNYSDYYEDYYYDDYDWMQQENPCSNSYYYNARKATNILATDLGVIAKRGENKSYFVAINNIVTTEPVAGASVTLYTYQQQKIAAAETGADGTIKFKSDKFAYFAIVTKGEQSTYVKLDDGNSLSSSNFDVAGAETQKGLKGYIYGERGVWRPGDNVYLSFILDDSGNKLPTGHPVNFRFSDPRGKVVFQKTQNANSYNHYAIVIPTAADVPTGNWEARVSVGGAHFYKSIKIETIKPNRLKIKNSLGSELLSAARPSKVNLEVTWLHGAIAKNNKVLMQAKFTQQTTTFKNYPNYRFDDNVRKFSSEEISVFSGKTDEAGKATTTIDPRLTGAAPGMLKMALITKVYEEGGDVSTDVTASTWSPYPVYVGIKSPSPGKYGMLETRTNNSFEIVTVNERGMPVPVSGLQVKVYKTKWRWWWDAGSEDVSNFQSGTATSPFKQFIVNTDGSGKATVNLRMTDEEWGRYIIRITDPSGGHATGTDFMVDWPTWSGKTREGDASSANMLVFTTDKKEYAVGESAMVTFPSSEGSRALVSIENGHQVVKTLWVSTVKGETTFTVPITADMAPNIYFNITLLQPHASTANDSPIRMYGILPVSVVDKNTVLKPQITMPDVLQPEQTFEVRVKEENRRGMTYTIAVVDEGLLDLTRFKTPNAWDDFYSKQALGVRTWDVYDDIIGAYGGKISQIFSIGGDQDLGGGKAKKANRFKPAVVFLGPFVLPAGGAKTHKVTMPKYIGSVRVMVVAADHAAAAYGKAEKSVAVKSPLMVLASVPRKISPSERVTIPVTLFATEKHVKLVDIEVKTSGGIVVRGGNRQSVTFSEPDEKMAYFNIEVGQTTGTGKLQFIASSGRERSVYEVEIDVTNPNPLTHAYTDVVLGPNSTKTLSWNTFGVQGTNRAELEVSSSPSIDINRRMTYLIEYPHGCVEQTTSAAFPQLYLSELADIDESRKKNIQNNVAAAISSLNKFQLSGGGLTYWPGTGQADDWGTTYAGHFILEAEKKGYVLPIGFKSKWISFQQREARNWRMGSRPGSDFAQAYRLYTLALANVPDLASMNRLKESSGLSNEAKLRLAAAYVVAGQKNAAIGLLSKSSLDGSSENNFSNYGSPERNRAMALETLVLAGQKIQAFELAKRLAMDLSSSQWMSTQTTAYSLYAMAQFSRQYGSKGISVAYKNAGREHQIATSKAYSSKELIAANGANSITLTNKKDNTLYVRILNSGILPIGKEQPIQNNLTAEVTFKDRRGTLVDVTKIKQGTEFLGIVTITNRKNQRVNNVALTQILPSGFEILNTRFTEYGDASANIADYIDIRDDRANYYFDMKAGESKTFRMVLNASYTGTYYLPGVQCEAMYDHSVIARTKGKWIEVLK